MDKKLTIIKTLDENRLGLQTSEISTLIQTDLPTIRRYIDIFAKEKIIRKERKNDITRIFLSYTPEDYPNLSKINAIALSELPKKIQVAAEEFLIELKEKPMLALITGSHANGNHTATSELDLLLVFKELKDAKQIEKAALKIENRIIVKINPKNAIYTQFKADFLNKKHEFPTEIRTKVIILSGLEYYYELIREYLYGPIVKEIKVPREEVRQTK